jgi:hypothetical protein
MIHSGSAGENHLDPLWIMESRGAGVLLLPSLPGRPPATLEVIHSASAHDPEGIGHRM